MSKENEKITREYLLVIEHTNNKTNEQLNIEKFEMNLKILCEFYAIILHDRDTKINEEGEIVEIRKHYHAVIKTNKRIRKQTLLKQLAFYNNIPLEMIQIDYMENFILSIRYLLHMDNSEKVSYPPFMLITNSPFEIERIIETELYPNEITAKQIIFYVYEKRYTLAKILEIIGLKNFNKYAKTIAEIKKEAWDDPNGYERDNNKDTPF